jgi:hypothetical protein
MKADITAELKHCRFACQQSLVKDGKKTSSSGQASILQVVLDDGE